MQLVKNCVGRKLSDDQRAKLTGKSCSPHTLHGLSVCESLTMPHPTTLGSFGSEIGGKSFGC